MKSVICRRLKMRLKRVIHTGRISTASLAKKVNDEEGEAVGMDEGAVEREEEAKVAKVGAAVAKDDDDAEDGAPAQAAKRRKVLGAEDKAKAQEGKVYDEGEGEDDDESDGSGMYSEKEDDEQEKDEEDEGEEDVSGDEAAKDAKKKRLDEETEDEDGKDAEGQGEKAEADGKQASASKGKTGKAPKAAKDKAQSSLLAAINSGEVVWSSKLEANCMTVVINHRYKDCPHSLFVGEMLQDICKSA